MGAILEYAQANGLLNARGEDSRFLAGQERDLAQVSEAEVHEIVNKLDAAYQGATPEVTEMVQLSLSDIISTVQVVKNRSNSPFQGLTAAGNALDINPVRIDDIARLNGTTGQTDWLLNHTSTGNFNFLGSSSNPESMSTTSPEAELHMGFIDPVESPKLNAYQYYRFGDAVGPAQALNWRHRKTMGDGSLPAFRLPRPFAALPGDTYYVRARVEETGYDRLQPVAIVVARRSDITAI